MILTNWNSQQSKYPIYTLQTLTGRTIVVISPHLAGPIQRASKNLSFYSMILEVTKRLVDFDEPAMQIIRWNMNGEHGEHGLMNESHDMVARMLSPGPILNSMTSVQLDQFSQLVNDVVPPGQTLEIGLHEFVRRVFTVANAYTIYGPRNPFAVHPDLVKAFWDYEAGMIPLLANVFPAITARKPYLARKAVNAGLVEFIESGAYQDASPMIRERVDINLKYGLGTKMAGHAELILLFGILGNAVPTTFWLLANLFSRPELLQRVREETLTAVGTDENGQKVISVGKLKAACPLLVSTYRETLRSIANLASVRLVLGTHEVGCPVSLTPFPNTYLLKKGAMIQIASGVIHGAESVWGKDAKEFVPERFISSTTPPLASSTQLSDQKGNSEQSRDRNEIRSAERTASLLPKGVPAAAWRAFGGGSVICPGRHFAQSEILGFAALVVLGFEIKDLSGGVIKQLVRDDARIPLSVMKPIEEVKVGIRRREGAWRVEK